ncbi:MAG TPA: preprotein translocase subunit SecE [Polyangiales bacterium]|nr:preprotein translocase subunit SecE [Polyangiales bacterium]
MSATDEITRDSEQQETPRGAGGSGMSTVSSRGLGLNRWVQYVFVVIAAFVLWLADKLVLLAWGTWDEPNEVVATVLSAAIGVTTALVLYRNEKSHRLVVDVVSELSKVTWPSRKETYASTIVVIVTSLIAAAIVGSFDFVWSAITDLLYKYKV